MSSSFAGLNLASASSEGEAVLSLGSFVVPKQGRPFNILASLNNKHQHVYKIGFLDGEVKTVTSNFLSTLPVKTAGEVRLANLIRYAFNPDFDAYVKTSLHNHNLPVDEAMMWAKWLESVFKATVPQEERRDEAIHNMLIHTLYSIDILANFDPSRLSPENQALPLAKQVSVYLKNYFLYQKSKIIKWLDSTYGTSDELLILDGGNQSVDGDQPPVLEHGETDTEQQVGVTNSLDVDKFRKLFTQWVTRPAISPRVRNRVLSCMNIILDSPATKATQLIGLLAQKLGVSEPTAKRVFHVEFPAFVQKFMQTPEGKSLNSSSIPTTQKTSHMEEPMRSRRFAVDNQHTQNPSAPPQPPASPSAPLAPGQRQGKCTKCGTQGVVGTDGHCSGCSTKTATRKRANELYEEAEVAFSKTPSAKDVEHTTITVDNERVLPSKEDEPEGQKIKVEAKYATLRRIAEEEPKEISQALTELATAFSSLAEASEALVENLDLTPISGDASLKDKVASRKKFASTLRRLAADDPEKVEEAVQELYQSIDEIAQAIENLAENLDIDLGIDSEIAEVDNNINEAEEGLNEFEEEIGSEAPAILDAFEEDKASSSSEVCHTQSGGTWTQYKTGDEEKLMAASDGTSWDITDKVYATRYLSQGPVYVLTDNQEAIAAYSPNTNTYVDATDADAHDTFAEELEELLTAIGE